MMRRVIVIVIDGCGVGALPDAADFGMTDPQSATLPHVADAMGGLTLPNLEALGLGNITPILGIRPVASLGAWGKSAEASQGKDSVTGHWEMMGIITPHAFPTYPNGFPDKVIEAFSAKIGHGVLGNIAGSGTEIIQRYGVEHMASGKPIIYTSADSVFQVAAHEEIIPIAELYAICQAARDILIAPNNVLRVIARPFIGDSLKIFVRTERRRDFTLPPPSPNALEVLRNAGKRTHAIGVIGDLFPHDLFEKVQRTQNNPAHLAAILDAITHISDDFIFANCEDFDMKFGHRNDPIGFAQCLTEFDACLGPILQALKPDDLLLITADHGNDPTTVSTDHSREYVPLVLLGSDALKNRALGIRTTFADIAATVTDWLGIAWNGPGISLLDG